MDEQYWFAYYQTLRLEARSRVVDALNRRISTPEDREKWRGITLSSINTEAIDYARTHWPRYYSNDLFNGMPYSWERLYFKFHAIFSNFNIAVWQEYDDIKILQGLAFGKPSKGKTHLVVNWLERSYEPPYFPGGVLLPILASAEEYAKLLGCERVLIKDAVDPLEFQGYGYAPHKLPNVRASYLAKELDHG